METNIVKYESKREERLISSIMDKLMDSDVEKIERFTENGENAIQAKVETNIGKLAKVIFYKDGLLKVETTDPITSDSIYIEAKVEPWRYTSVHDRIGVDTKLLVDYMDRAMLDNRVNIVDTPYDGRTDYKVSTDIVFKEPILGVVIAGFALDAIISPDGRYELIMWRNGEEYDARTYGPNDSEHLKLRPDWFEYCENLNKKNNQ